MYSDDQKCLSLTTADMYYLSWAWSPWILGLSSQCSNRGHEPLSYCFQSSRINVRHPSDLLFVVSSLFLTFGSWQEFFLLLGIWIFH